MALRKKACMRFVSPTEKATAANRVDIHSQPAHRANPDSGGKNHMNLREKIRETGAAGYILLWLLGIPIPILLLIFLLRGCT